MKISRKRFALTFLVKMSCTPLVPPTKPFLPEFPPQAKINKSPPPPPPTEVNILLNSGLQKSKFHVTVLGPWIKISKILLDSIKNCKKERIR